MTFVAAFLLGFVAVETLHAQRLLLGAGAAAGTVPRALAPLCGSARRLNGVGVTARAGFDARSFRVFSSLDYVGRFGVTDAADCIARSGVWVDSTFAPAGNSATSLSIGGSIPLYNVVHIGAEIGRVLDHSSWFIGPAVGIQVRRVRIETAVRRHSASFEEITRENETGSVREISRKSRSESSWGAIARLLLLNL